MINPNNRAARRLAAKKAAKERERHNHEVNAPSDKKKRKRPDKY